MLILRVNNLHRMLCSRFEPPYVGRAFGGIEAACASFFLIVSQTSSMLGLHQSIFIVFDLCLGASTSIFS